MTYEDDAIKMDDLLNEKQEVKPKKKKAQKKEEVDNPFAAMLSGADVEAAQQKRLGFGKI